MALVSHLFIKKAEDRRTTPVSSISAIRGYGLEGDSHVDKISPRQVLVTRKEDLDELGIVHGALLENVIVAGLESAVFRPGALLCIGNDVKIRLTFHCEPCKRIANAVPSLAAVVRKRGILGVILESGNMQTGDEVICLPDRYEPLSAIPYERFLHFMWQVPAGKVVTYKMVAQGMGVSEGYIRAMPGYVQKAVKAGHALPFIVDSNGASMEAERLWQGTSLYLSG